MNFAGFVKIFNIFALSKCVVGEILKSQVFLYEADTDRLEEAYKRGSAIATDILKSYVNAEFFTELPPVDEIIQVVRRFFMVRL